MIALAPATIDGGGCVEIVTEIAGVGGLPPPQAESPATTTRARKRMLHFMVCLSELTL
jgi:hypothetical protein